MSLVECLLCPHRCRLGDYERGKCRVRINMEGKLNTLVYGRATTINVDPVEKKPLFHFLPGSQALSVATVGCNLACKFCQNYELSQRNPEDQSPGDWQYTPPEKLVATAQKMQTQSIAYTYSDPVAFYEYAYDSSVLAKKAGIRNIMVTAGYIEKEPLTELLQVSDAFNTDIKALDDDYYRNMCGGTLQPVLDGVIATFKSGVWLELTNLIVPTRNDDPGLVRALARWIVENLSVDVPLHFSRFFPCYRLNNLPETPASTLEKCWHIARDEGLRYVYVGNLSHPANHTYCPQCGIILIERKGYTITQFNLLLEKDTRSAYCPKCAEVIAGVWG